MPEATRLVTAEELEQMSRPRCELVEGRLVEMSPVNLDHGTIVVQLTALLHGHVQPRSLGAIVIEVGFKLASNPDTVRSPDIAFIRAERVATARRHGFVDGPPDLAIEVLSPEDRAGEIRQKTHEYLTRGTSVVVIVNPDDRTVVMHRPGTSTIRLSGPDDVVDLNDVVPGFRCTLTQIFG
jgi:Uma2 family endonuclease